MASPKKRVNTLAANGKALYQVECSKVVLRAENRSRFDIVGFAPSTAFKRRTDFWRYVRVKNGVASIIIQKMLQESPQMARRMCHHTGPVIHRYQQSFITTRLAKTK